MLKNRGIIQGFADRSGGEAVCGSKGFGSCGFIKNLQPISVGVWVARGARFFGIESCKRLSQTLMRIEVKFTSIPFL